MLRLSPRSQLIIGFIVVTLMALTRGHFFDSFYHFPGASWAVFFLAAVYLRPPWVFAVLVAEAVLLDFAAVSEGGTGAFCISSAYAFLLPAYCSMWLAGRWYRARYHFSWPTLWALAGSLLAGAFFCELFSSGGFYVFSGRFPDPSFMEFSLRFMKYFPAYLGSLAFYVGLTAITHGIVCFIRWSSVGRLTTN